MDRNELITRIVDRKMENKGHGKVFCVCMVARSQGEGTPPVAKR